MKKFGIYIVCALFGLLIGWFLFGQKTDTHKVDEEVHATVDQQWTCSMHPQILLPDQGSCPICGMDLIPVDESGAGLHPNAIKMTANAMALANIETHVVGEVENRNASLNLSGKIRPNEQTNATQTAHFTGRIEQLHVNTTGERVHKGQLLATIYSPELVSAQQELITAMKSKNRDPDLYWAVRNKLQLWKLSEDQILGIEQSSSIIPNFSIHADVSGIVTEKLVEEGNHVKEGQGLFNISNLNTVWAEFDLYEKQLAMVGVGDSIQIATNANPNKQFHAKISFIEPVLNEQSRTVLARAVLNNKDGSLKPGMFVSGMLTQSNSEKTTALVIPKTAVLWTGNRSLVYVKKPGQEPVFEMRLVTLGSEINGNYEILDGLRNGEEIVSNGTFTVDAAAQLQGKKSMMNHEDSNRIQTAPEFQQQLNEVFERYIDLKSSLVKDNARNSREKANQMNTALRHSNLISLTDETWQADLQVLTTTSMAIAQQNDLEIQRKHFLELSDYMIKSVERFGINQVAYKQFCPMANNDQGGYWLSKEEEILNPYFGASMLHCGNVESIIK